MSDFDPTQFRLIPKGRSFRRIPAGSNVRAPLGPHAERRRQLALQHSHARLQPPVLQRRVRDARTAIRARSLNPFLVLCTVVGLSVEDLSEAGGPFLGIDELTFHRARLPGRHADRAQQRRLGPRVGIAAGVRHRHLAHGGLQPARRARGRLQALEPGAPKRGAKA